MLKRFGFAPDRRGEACAPDQTTETPIGRRCAWCNELICEGDKGIILPSYGGVGDPPFLAEHFACFMRQVVGSVGHVTHLCACYGGDLDDPPGLTKRQAADAAVAAYRAVLKPHHHL